MAAVALTPTKTFQWDADLHPRDEKGRFVRSWREVTQAAWDAKVAYFHHFNSVPIPDRGPARSKVRAERDRLHLQMQAAEDEVLNWLLADKGMAVPPPPRIQQQFYGPERPLRATAVAEWVKHDRPTAAQEFVQEAFALYADDRNRLAINTALRGGWEPDFPNDNVVKIMDRALDGARVVTQEAIAYRGLSMADPPEVGDVIIDDGFSSMIDDPTEAIDFALGRAAGLGRFADKMEGEPTGHIPVLLEVLIPPGTRVVTDGWEIIPPRGSAFEIVGRADSGALVAVLVMPDAEQRLAA